MMRDMRESPDIGYRGISGRVRLLLEMPVVTRSLSDEAKAQAQANADNLRDRFFAWLMAPNAGTAPLRLELVRTVHDRLERFMLGTDVELRGGTPFTVIGQLAHHPSAEAAMRFLLQS